MSEDHSEPEKIWDEYDWERFLKDQDQKAQRYLDLLERYSDHPRRDEIVAEEMGWLEFVSEDIQVWMSDSSQEQEEDGEEESARGNRDGREGEEEDAFEGHPLYRRVLELTVWLDEVFARKGDVFAEHPAAMVLSDQICELGAKLAAALSDSDGDEIGMTIAYLKRALHATHRCLEAVLQLHKERLLGRMRVLRLRGFLFEVRDGIVGLMGENRMEWRRRQAE